MTKLMRAAWYDRTGPSDEVLCVGDLTRPAPAPGEMLVAIQATAVNPSDVKRRSGWRATAQISRRVIPHSDGAGIVEDIGQGVDPAWRGRRVWVFDAQRSSTYGGTAVETGTAAQYVALDARLIVPLPESASFEVGACLGIPACTAHRAVFADGPVEGLTVLVQGAAGAVGELATQFASSSGARVIAVVSSPEKASVAKAAGADQTVNRKEDGIVDAIRAAAPEGIDRVIEVDFGANAATDVAVLNQDGIIVAYASTSAPEPQIPYYPLQHRGALIRLIASFHLPAASRARALADTTFMVGKGTLRPTIGAVLPLENIAKAHRLKESGTIIGSVVVSTNDSAAPSSGPRR